MKAGEQYRIRCYGSDYIIRIDHIDLLTGDIIADYNGNGVGGMSNLMRGAFALESLTRLEPYKEPVTDLAKITDQALLHEIAKRQLEITIRSVKTGEGVQINLKS